MAPADDDNGANGDLSFLDRLPVTEEVRKTTGGLRYTKAQAEIAGLADSEWEAMEAVTFDEDEGAHATLNEPGVLELQGKVDALWCKRHPEPPDGKDEDPPEPDVDFDEDRTVLDDWQEVLQPFPWYQAKQKAIEQVLKSAHLWCELHDEAGQKQVAKPMTRAERIAASPSGARLVFGEGTPASGGLKSILQRKLGSKRDEKYERYEAQAKQRRDEWNEKHRIRRYDKHELERMALGDLQKAASKRKLNVHDAAGKPKTAATLVQEVLKKQDRDRARIRAHQEARRLGKHVQEPCPFHSASQHLKATPRERLYAGVHRPEPNPEPSPTKPKQDGPPGYQPDANKFPNALKQDPFALAMTERERERAAKKEAAKKPPPPPCQMREERKHKCTNPPFVTHFKAGASVRPDAAQESFRKQERLKHRGELRDRLLAYEILRCLGGKLADEPDGSGEGPSRTLKHYKAVELHLKQVGFGLAEGDLPRVAEVYKALMIQSRSADVVTNNELGYPVKWIRRLANEDDETPMPPSSAVMSGRPDHYVTIVHGGPTLKYLTKHVKRLVNFRLTLDGEAGEAQNREYEIVKNWVTAAEALFHHGRDRTDEDVAPNGKPGVGDINWCRGQAAHRKAEEPLKKSWMQYHKLRRCFSGFLVEVADQFLAARRLHDRQLEYVVRKMPDWQDVALHPLDFEDACSKGPDDPNCRMHAGCNNQENADKSYCLLRNLEPHNRKASALTLTADQGASILVMIVELWEFKKRHNPDLNVRCPACLRPIERTEEAKKQHWQECQSGGANKEPIEPTLPKQILRWVVMDDSDPQNPKLAMPVRAKGIDPKSAGERNIDIEYFFSFNYEWRNYYEAQHTPNLVAQALTSVGLFAYS